MTLAVFFFSIQDVDLLPEGDWTLIGEKGIELSDGQKARLCLARYVKCLA